MSKNTIKDLARSLASINFEDENEALKQLETELRHVKAKGEETRKEAQRLANAVQNFNGPDPDRIATAILEGATLADATSASPTRAELEARRDALFAALRPLQEREERLATEIAAVKSRAFAKVREAAKPYFEHLAALQVEAAEVIIDADAAMQTFAQIASMHVPAASRRARDGLTGPDTLLGLRAQVPVPETLQKAMQSLPERCAAIRSIPSSIYMR